MKKRPLPRKRKRRRRKRPGGRKGGSEIREREKKIPDRKGAGKYLSRALRPGQGRVHESNEIYGAAS